MEAHARCRELTSIRREGEMKRRAPDCFEGSRGAGAREVPAGHTGRLIVADDQVATVRREGDTVPKPRGRRLALLELAVAPVPDADVSGHISRHEAPRVGFEGEARYPGDEGS